MKFKAGCGNKVSSRVEFCGHCSCVTSLSADVSVPGPPLNISHCHLLLSSFPEKGNQSKLCCARSPLFSLPSLSTCVSPFSPFSSHLTLLFHKLQSSALHPSIPRLYSDTSFPIFPDQRHNRLETCMWCNPNRLHFPLRNTSASTCALQSLLRHSEPSSPYPHVFAARLHLFPPLNRRSMFDLPSVP